MIQNKSMKYPIPGKHPLMWVLVADDGVARVYIRTGQHLRIRSEIFPPSVPLDEELANDTVGRNANSATGQRHKYEPSMNESRQDELEFAREICFWINKSAQDDEFERIVVIAAPKMLGMLRPGFSAVVQDRIIAEINKDLTGQDLKKLEKDLPSLIANAVE
jgi:protein required for attachment to host cells